MSEEEFNTIFEREMQRKRASRKWRAFLYAFGVSTILLLLNQVEGVELLTGTQWVTFNTLTYGTYAGANVWETKKS